MVRVAIWLSLFISGLINNSEINSSQLSNSLKNTNCENVISAIETKNVSNYNELISQQYGKKEGFRFANK